MSKQIKIVFGSVLVALVSILMIQGFASCGSKENRLEKAVKQLNTMLPMKLGNGFTMQKIEQENNALVYEITCNEHLVDMEAIEQNKEELKDNSIAQLKGEKKRSKDFASLLEFCQEKGTNIIYRYKGSSSKKAIDIVVNPDEI